MKQGLSVFPETFLIIQSEACVSAGQPVQGPGVLWPDTSHNEPRHHKYDYTLLIIPLSCWASVRLSAGKSNYDFMENNSQSQPIPNPKSNLNLKWKKAEEKQYDPGEATTHPPIL